MTEQTIPAFVHDDTYTVERTVLIRTDRHTVWAALTTPELITEWFGQRASFDSLAVGGRGTLGFDGYGEVPVEIVEIDEPDVFAFRWGGRDDAALGEENSTLVHFTLVQVPDGTALTVVETGFNTLAGDDAYRRGRAEDNRTGWNGELDELVAFLEKQDSL
ncbi:MAG: ATPase [Rhodoglobus sp.]|nr:ATPase [Rhodoglobus sp.]